MMRPEKRPVAKIKAQLRVLKFHPLASPPSSDVYVVAKIKAQLRVLK